MNRKVGRNARTKQVFRQRTKVKEKEQKLKSPSRIRAERGEREIQSVCRRKGRGGREEERNLLNVISSDVAGIVGCHHGLHLHQVLLHASLFYIHPTTQKHTLTHTQHKHRLSSLSFSLSKISVYYYLYLSVCKFDCDKYVSTRKHCNCKQKWPLLFLGLSLPPHKTLLL